ncbi:MAG: JAB domain-containing protein [Erythrobacter sp.]
MSVPPEAQLGPLVAYLRSVVLHPQAERERCHALFVDARRSCIGDAGIGRGGRSGLRLRMREIFGEALRLDARGIILAHNHPSGVCRPSGCDIAATGQLAEVAKALDIELIDHLIFTHEAVYSMRAGGLL